VGGWAGGWVAGQLGLTPRDNDKTEIYLIRSPIYPMTQYWLDILGYTILFIIFVICVYIYFRTDDFELKCIVSTVDGNKYCVRERHRIQESADLLAKVAEKCRDLVDYVGEKHPHKECVKLLVKNFNPQKIVEILPTSSYTAYSENKGEKIAFCLNVTKGGKENLIDEHTLTFVAIHELSHISCSTIGHTTQFWDNFKFLLQNAKEAGIHEPIDYSQKPTEYCSMKITDNPYYN